MDSLYFLIPIALVLMGLAVKFLFWAVNNGQYDDLDTEAHRILFDDDTPAQKKSAPKKPEMDEKTNSDSVL